MKLLNKYIYISIYCESFHTVSNTKLIRMKCIIQFVDKLILAFH